jgi:hypothetical protein
MDPLLRTSAHAYVKIRQLLAQRLTQACQMSRFCNCELSLKSKSYLRRRRWATFRKQSYLRGNSPSAPKVDSYRLPQGHSRHAFRYPRQRLKYIFALYISPQYLFFIRSTCPNLFRINFNSHNSNQSNAILYSNGPDGRRINFSWTERFRQL